MKQVIFGAGMAGLIAACKFPNALVFEAGKERTEHQALLRFRSTAVSEATGIPFKKVKVTKEVIDSDNHTWHGTCPIKLQNQYSLKVSGGVMGRSIANLETVERYVAPDDFHQQLIERFRDRITFEAPVTLGDIQTFQEDGTHMISTIPLPAMMKIIGDELSLQKSAAAFKFSMSGIKVYTIELAAPESDVYQTIYFPSFGTNLYRASITGNKLIVEMIGKDNKYFIPRETMDDVLNIVRRAFGIYSHLGIPVLDMKTFKESQQSIGKMIELPKEERQALLYAITKEFGIFSLGRFACWRSILLDEVAGDISQIERLINASDYSKFLTVSAK